MGGDFAEARDAFYPAGPLSFSLTQGGYSLSLSLSRARFRTVYLSVCLSLYLSLSLPLSPSLSVSLPLSLSLCFLYLCVSNLAVARDEVLRHLLGVALQGSATLLPLLYHFQATS